MTKQNDLKQRVRRRMDKTGESYSAARRQLFLQLESSTIPATMVPNYPEFGGAHVDTATLCHCLAQAGVRQEPPLNEAMIFGLTGGIGFMYFVFEYKALPPMLTLCMRSFTMPEVIVERALTHLQIPYSLKQTGSSKVAQGHLQECLLAGKAALCTVDTASLPYYGISPQWIGNMPQQVAVVAQDDKNTWFEDGCDSIVCLPNEQFTKARAAIKKAKHRLISIDSPVPTLDLEYSVKVAMASTVKAHHVAPFKGFAGNFGLKGLHKWLKLLVSPKDKKGWPRLFASGEARLRGLLRLQACIHHDYTAKSGGRGLYGSFLDQSAELLGESWPKEAAELYRLSATQWDGLCARLFQSEHEVLKKAFALQQRRYLLLREKGHRAAEQIVAVNLKLNELLRSGDLPGDHDPELFEALHLRLKSIIALEEQALQILAKGCALGAEFQSKHE